MGVDEDNQQLKQAWRLLFDDCIAALQSCFDGELKHFHKARYRMAVGLHCRGDDHDSDKSKEELAFCFKTQRSLFTINMWEIDESHLRKSRWNGCPNSVCWYASALTDAFVEAQLDAENYRNSNGKVSGFSQAFWVYSFSHSLLMLLDLKCLIPLICQFYWVQLIGSTEKFSILMKIFLWHKNYGLCMRMGLLETAVFNSVCAILSGVDQHINVSLNWGCQRALESSSHVYGSTYYFIWLCVRKLEICSPWNVLIHPWKQTEK